MSFFRETVRMQSFHLFLINANMRVYTQTLPLKCGYALLFFSLKGTHIYTDTLIRLTWVLHYSCYSQNSDKTSENKE